VVTDVTSAPTTYPPIIDGMYRVRWWVAAVCFTIAVFYPLDWYASERIGEGTCAIAFVFLWSQLGYRLWFEFRNGLREPS
jgi:hypothetical protein